MNLTEDEKNAIIFAYELIEDDLFRCPTEKLREYHKNQIKILRKLVGEELN